MRSFPILLAATAALALAACHGGNMAMSPTKTAQTAIGPVLTDGKDMTLYVFDKDAPGKSNCNGGCAKNWPPLMADAGAQALGDYSVVKRDDGGSQWAYKGRPLYGWVKDQKPGDTSGDGFLNGAWHAAKP